MPKTWKSCSVAGHGSYAGAVCPLCASGGGGGGARDDKKKDDKKKK